MESLKIDFTKALEKAMKYQEAKEVKPATDKQVEAEILRIAETVGYIPSKQIIEPIRAYLSGYGILLSGEAGIGKTMLMSALGMRMYGAVHIASYGLRNLYKWYEWSDNHNICIDDIGTETIVSEYGAKDEIMKRVIAHRAEQQSGRTSITTNLDSDEIAKRYDDRTLSRILGMCKTFQMTGTNRRKPVAVKVDNEQGGK